MRSRSSPGIRRYRDLAPDSLKMLTREKHPVIVDGRNVLDPDLFIRNGFVYKGIGRGDKNLHPLG